MDAQVAALSRDLAKPGTTSPETLDEAGRALAIEWPDDYRGYMVEAGGGEGWVGPGYLALWKANELVEMNRLAEIKRFEPDLVGIGTNGGGELFAYDTSRQGPILVMTPSVDLTHDSWIDIGSFRDLLGRLASDTLFDPRDIQPR